MTRVLLVSEHELLRQGLSRLLGDAESIVVAGEAKTAEHALEDIQETNPHVILLHVGHPVGNRIRDMHLLREKASDIPVVLLLDAVEDELMLVAMQAGAAGCLDKTVSAGHLAQALYDAASGEIALSERFARRLARIFAGSTRDGTRQPYPDALTRRELEVLGLLAHGLTNREIARSLFVSESTVRAHLRTVTQKLGVHNRVHAVARALEMGMVPPLTPSEDSMPSLQAGRKLA